jgi:DMSO/TMAO reductase YedYZ heme-binding membrane subunit
MKKRPHEDDDDDDDEDDDSPADRPAFRPTAGFVYRWLKWACVALAVACFLVASGWIALDIVVGRTADNAIKQNVMETRIASAYLMYLPCLIWIVTALFFQQEEHRRDKKV